MSTFRTLALAAAATMLAAASAHAANFSVVDNFDSYQSTGSTLDFTGFSHLSVVTGTVDLIHNGDFGIGSFSCCYAVDLNGDNTGKLQTNTFSFSAGDKVSLTMEVSGNDRSGANDFSFGFETAGANFAANDIMVNQGSGFFAIPDFPSTPALASGNPFNMQIASNAPFALYGITFTAGSAGSVTAFVAGDPNASNAGPILDDFNLSVTSGGVPEPASWALMIGGFGLAGAALRRRRAAIA